MITAFRADYPESLMWSYRAKSYLRPTMDSLYRDCQEFAAVQIKKTVDEAFSRLADAEGRVAGQVLRKAKKAGR
jgi:hypothetical protein